MKKYNFIQLISLIINVFISKLLISSKVRIIRLPWFILGKENIFFSHGFSAGKRLKLEVVHKDCDGIFFGKNVKINDDVRISCANNIFIGNNALIGSKVLITDHQHGSYKGDAQDSPYSVPDTRSLFSEPVKIEDNVWIGEMVVILPGVAIGSGSIIGANSVVTKNIERRCIVAGNPCRVIKKYNPTSKKWERYND